MFDHRNDCHRVARPQAGFRHHLRQHGSLCPRHRRARRIVCFDPEPREFGHHSPRQGTIRRDERHAALRVLRSLLQAQTKRDRDGRRFLAFVCRLDERDLAECVEHPMIIDTPAPGFPGVCRLRRGHGTRQEFGTVSEGLCCGFEHLDISALKLHVAKQMREAILRMPTNGRARSYERDIPIVQLEPIFVRHVEIEPRQHHDALVEFCNGSDQFRRCRDRTCRAGNDDGPIRTLSAKTLGFRPQHGIAVARRRGSHQFLQSRRPEAGGDLEKLKSQLPPGPEVCGLELLQIAPITSFRLRRLDQFDECPGQPDGICRARRCHERRICMDRPHDLRQLVAPGKDEPRQFEEHHGAADRRRKVHQQGSIEVEKAAVVVRLSECADIGQNGSAPAEQIDEFGAQHARRASCRHKQRHACQRKRIRRVVAKALG